jgi:hypothetical protein
MADPDLCLKVWRADKGEGRLVSARKLEEFLLKGIIL